MLWGKWITYRKIAEDAIDAAILAKQTQKEKMQNRKNKTLGYKKNIDWSDQMHVYGSLKKKVESLGGKEDNKSLSSKFYISNNIIKWSIIHEMAITLEDVLARRTRCVFLDSNESKKIAPGVAKRWQKF